MAEKPSQDATLNEIRDLLRSALAERRAKDARFEYILGRLVAIERDMAWVRGILREMSLTPETEAMIDGALSRIEAVAPPTDLIWKDWLKK